MSFFFWTCNLFISHSIHFHLFIYFYILFFPHLFLSSFTICPHFEFVSHIDYLIINWNSLFANLLKTLQQYYHAKESSSYLQYDLFFSDFCPIAKYWNSNRIKLLLRSRVGQSTSSTKHLKYFLVLQAFKYFFKYCKRINTTLCHLCL